MTNQSKPTSRRAIQLVVLLVATLGSFALAEIAARVLFPGKYELVRFVLPNGEYAPMAEGWHYLFHSRDAERNDRSTPRGWFPSDVSLFQGYDRPQWHYFDEHGAVEITTNRLGFRDDEFAVEKADGQFRILAVGDSFTYGLGVPLELTWPQLVEDELASDGRDVEVINAGCPNTGPVDYLDWFRRDGVRFDPDLVIVGLCLNDMSAEVPMLAYPTPTIDTPWLGGFSMLLNHIQREIAQRELMRETRDYGAAVRANPTEWHASQAALLELKRLAEEHGAKFVLAVQPMVSQLGELYPYASLHEMVAEFCDEHAIETVDLLPAFRGRNERDLWVHPIDQHPNHIGHALIARDLVAFLVARGLDR